MDSDLKANILTIQGVFWIYFLPILFAYKVEWIPGAME